MKKLHLYLDEELKNAKTDDQIKQAILNAYDRVEKDWIKFCREPFDMGFAKVAYVGSCALIAVIKDNKAYIANAGDSKAALLREKDNGEYEYVKASVTFNANKKNEQARLRAQFPTEKDIVVCKNNDPKACYVKGNLMPSRALGDVRLKLQDFNKHMWPPEKGYRIPIPNFNGPYITHVPEITMIDLTNKDRFLILASDGLWDEISRKSSPKIASSAEKQEV